MTIQGRTNSIINKVHLLIKNCYPEFKFKISYLTIFSQSKEDFDDLRSFMKNKGEESKANNGYKYNLSLPFKYSGEQISLIRIRKPDVHRKELGCGDLFYQRKDY